MSSASKASDRENEVYVWTHSELTTGQPRLEWVNVPKRWAEDLGRDLPYVPAGTLYDPDEGSDIGTGLPKFVEAPIFVVDRSIRSKPLFDISGGHRDLILVSERAKGVLERVDSEAFEFLEVETRLPTGERGPRYWLGDVVRKLDAFDLERSEGARVTQTAPYKCYVLGVYKEKNIFKRSAVGNAHFFRLLNCPGRIFCDAVARAAINEQPKLRGIACFPEGKFDA